MRKILITTIIAIFALSGCASNKQEYLKEGKEYGSTSGTFRDRWWNYYERGLSFSEGQFHDEAARDFQTAIEKREKDQWRSRTYGMHFVDYFPHRELGIVYYNQKRYPEAVRELEESLRTAESSKAKFFLNRARAAILEQNGKDILPPALKINFPGDGFITNKFSVMLKGMAEDDNYFLYQSIMSYPWSLLQRPPL
jgi:tetratricopeptide (TPR) repeat protein